MKIATRVKRYQAVVLWFIVGMLAISLVFWGNVPGEGRDRPAVAGVIFGDKEIAWNDYAAVRNVVVPMMRIHQYKGFGGVDWQNFGRYGEMIIRGKFRFPDPEADAVAKETWKYIVALYDADQKGITVTNKELQQEIESFGRPLSIVNPRTRQIDMARYEDFVGVLFRTSVPAFEDALRKYMTIEKLIDLVSEAEIPAYVTAFQDVMQNKRKAKIRYAEFKPEDYRGELTAVSEADIAKFYKEKKDAPEHGAHLKDPKKAVIEYLVVTFESLKEKTTDPTEGEMKKFYDENMTIFEIVEEKKPEEKHDHVEGEKPHADEKKDEKKFKSFADVKDDVKNRIKLNLAEDLAYDLIKKVYAEIGAAMEKVKSGDSVDLAPIAEKHSPVRHDSLVVAEGRAKEAEEVLGSGSEIDRNCFQRLHDTEYADLVKTTKGFLLYRLNKTIEPKSRPLAMEDVKEYIEKELKKQQLKDIARRKAQDVSNEINRAGISRSSRAQALAFRTSEYFDQNEAREVGPFARFAFTPTLTIGQSTISDDPGGGKTWLVYLEDVVTPPSADAGREFHEMWKKNLQRSKYRYEADWYRMGSNRALLDNYIKTLMEKATLVDHVGKTADGNEKRESPIEDETP